MAPPRAGPADGGEPRSRTHARTFVDRAGRSRGARRPLALALRQRAPAHDAGDRAAWRSPRRWWCSRCRSWPASSTDRRGRAGSRLRTSTAARRRPLCFALGLWLLGALQLVPLPRALHALLAPGSASVWHPAEAAAAAVLGPGPHPVSLYPAATARWLAFFAAMVSLALLSAPALRERRTLLRSTVAVVAAAVVLTLYAFVARLWFGDRVFGVYESLIPPFGPFVSKNHFAGYVEMAALLAVGLATGLASENRTGPGALGWIESPRASRVVLAWAAAAVLVLAVPVSLSRGGVISLAGRTRRLRAAAIRDARDVRLAATRSQSRAGSSQPRRPLAAVAVAVARLPLRPARAGPRPRRHDRRGRRRFLVVLPPRPLARHAAARRLESRRRLRLRRVRRCHPAVQDRRRQRPRRARRERRPRAARRGRARRRRPRGGRARVPPRGGVARRARRPAPALARRPRQAPSPALVALLVHSLLDFNLHIPSNALLAALLAAIVSMPLRPHESRAGRSNAGLTVAVAVSLALGIGTPWTEARGLGGLSSQSGSLRRTTSEATVVTLLRGRPSDPGAWLVLAWLRVSVHPADSRALTAWARLLDPEDQRVSEAARQLDAAAGGGRPAER